MGCPLWDVHSWATARRLCHPFLLYEAGRTWRGGRDAAMRRNARARHHARSRSNLRITLPVVVIGMCSMKATSRGYSCAESRVRTKPLMSAASASLGACPDLSTMKALTISVRTGSGLPTTAASATAGCRIRQSSISVGADAVARRGDDIIVAADKLDIALGVGDALVARCHPVADELVAGRVGLAPIFQEHHRVGPLDRDLSELARPALRAVRPDHPDRVAGHRLADRAGARNAERRA